MTTPVVPVTLWDCACLSVVLVSVFNAVRVGVRIRLYGLRVCSRSPWFWCSCVCSRFADIGYGCAFTLRGSGARVFVCEYADMGYDCAALRGSGARVSVCGYADMGKACAFAFLGLVLEFTAECVHGAVGKDCALALLGLVLMFMSVAVQGRLHPVSWLSY